MSKRKSNPDAEPQGPPSFEDSMAELQGLVDAMENEALPLDTLVEHYEKGSRLLLHCEKLLDTARQRVETIQAAASSPDAKTKPALSDSPEDFTNPDGDDSDDDDDSENDDIRLF